MIWVALATLAGFLSWKFTANAKKEKQVNRAKVPDRVERWEPEVVSAAKEFNVPFPVAMAVLWVESAGDPGAVGSAKERGLYQLKEIAVADLKLRGFGTFPNWKTDPVQNIRAGVAYLALQHENTKRDIPGGSWFEAVKAYNQGYQGKSVFPERANRYLMEVREKEKFFT